MKNLKQFINDTFNYTFSKFFPAITGLIYVLIFSKIIGVNEYGKYSFLFYQFNLIASFSFGWLNQATLRYSSSFEQPSKKYLILSSMLLILPLLLILNFRNNISLNLLVISFFCILSISLNSYVRILLQSAFLSKSVAMLSLLQSMLSLALPAIYLFYRNGNGLILISFSSLSALIASIIFFTIKNKKFSQHSYKIIDNKQIYYKWLSFGLPVSIWAGLSLLLPYLDRIFISKSDFSSELGVFSTLSDFSTRFFSFAIFPFTMALYPKLSKFWNENNKKKTIIIIQDAIITIFIIILFAFFFMIVFRDNIIFLLKFLFPEISTLKLNIFFPIVLSGVIWQLSLIIHKIIELSEKTYLMITFIIFSIFVNIVGNLIFLPRFGIMATALTGLCSSMIYCFSAFFYFMKFRRNYIKR